MFNIRHLIRVAISLVLFVFFILYIHGTVPLTLMDQLERIAYDARVYVGMPGTVDPRIVIADIDDKTLKEQGQWPLPRDKFAQMIDQLFNRYHVKIVAFDVTFSEPDRSSDLSLLDQLAAGPLKGDKAFTEQADKLRPSIERDKIFATSLQHRPVALGYVFYAENAAHDQSVGMLPPPVIPGAQGQYPRVTFPKSVVYTTNLPVLAQAAASQGFFSNPTDSDGSVRRVNLLQDYNGDVYDSLDAAVLQVLQNNAPVKLEFDSDVPDMPHFEDVVVGNAEIPVDDEMNALVPFRGSGRRFFPYISVTDIIKGTAAESTLKDAIVYVGSTAPGLQDLRTTPVAHDYPGVEVHASFLSGVLDQRVMNDHPQYRNGAEAILCLLIAALITWVAIRKSVITGTLVTLSTGVAIVLLNLALWKYGQVVFPLAPSLTFLLALFVLHTLYGFFVESRGKRHLSRMFSQYIPPELVEEMDDRKDTASMESESRELTVMFADVRDFTSISEAMQPKDLSQLMNEYLTPMTRVIHTHRGTIDKYMGDAIMAFWGAPLHYPDHAKYAVDTALKMTETLTELNKSFKAKGWPELRIGVGMTTGMMSVGDMGSEFRRAYTVMGDAVNLSSRLEGLTKEYKVQVIVSEMTKDAVPDYSYLELDRVRVKGKEKPVGIYEPLGHKDTVDKGVKALLTRHRQALTLYRNQDWDGAEREFFSLQQSNPGRPLFGMYLDRITYFKNHPPGSGWDGVFVFKTK